MVEFETDIPTPEAAMNSFVVHPEEGEPHPEVLFALFDRTLRPFPDPRA